jgi:hypothetical protein
MFAKAEEKGGVESESKAGEEGGGAAAGENETVVRALVEAGFPEERVRVCLESVNWNESRAVELLLGD